MLTDANENQYKEDTQCADRTLSCSTIVKNVPILYEIIGRSKLAKLSKANEVVVSIRKVIN